MLEAEVRVIGGPEELATTIAERSWTKYGWGSVEQHRTEVYAFIRTARWHGRGSSRTPFGSRLRIPLHTHLTFLPPALAPQHQLLRYTSRTLTSTLPLEIPRP